MKLVFQGGVFEEDDGAIERALVAWKFAREGRMVVPTFDGTHHLCTLIGEGDPIVGRSKLSATDAAAHALNEAESRDYVERYGTEHYQELSALLVELEKLAS